MINCVGAGSYWPPAVPFPERCCCFFLKDILHLAGVGKSTIIRIATVAMVNKAESICQLILWDKILMSGSGPGGHGTHGGDDGFLRNSQNDDIGCGCHC